MGLLAVRNDIIMILLKMNFEVSFSGLFLFGTGTGTTSD